MANTKDKTCEKTPELVASRICILRLRLSSFLRYLCRRHGFMKLMRFNMLIEFLIKKMLLPKAGGPTIVPTIYGFKMVVFTTIDFMLEKQIFENGTYEAGTLDVLGQCLREGDIFMDIGSNIGLMSLYAAKAVGNSGRVYAFEPVPETFAVLNRNVEINGFPNIETHNIALGANATTANIYSVQHKRGEASLLVPMGDTSGGTEISVETLDEFVKREHINRVKMIKVDVEGWELEVLKGAKAILSSPEAPIICIEYSNLHPIHGGKQIDIYNTICDLNDYKVFKLQYGKGRVSQLIEITGPEQLPAHDNLFCLLDGQSHKIANTHMVVKR